MSLKSIYTEEVSLYEINTHADGPDGSLPLTPEIVERFALWRYIRNDFKCWYGMGAIKTLGG